MDSKNVCRYDLKKPGNIDYALQSCMVWSCIMNISANKKKGQLFRTDQGCADHLPMPFAANLRSQETIISIDPLRN